MLKMIAARMESEFKKHGITAEITFISASSFSLLVEDAAQFQAAKKIVAMLNTVQFESEVADDECGHFAYYNF